MKSATRLAVMTACTLALALSVGVPAHAKPIAPETMDVTLIEEGGKSLLLVAGELPEGTKLPAQVELPLPAGAHIQWAGELLGNGTANDIESTYTTRAADGSDVYVLTLTKSRVGQVEGEIAPVTGFDGTTYMTSLSWTPIAESKSARISVRIPTNSQITRTSPGEGGRLFTADSRHSYFSRTVEDVKAGEPLTLQFAYTPVIPGSSATSGSGSSGVIVALLVALAIAGFALAFVAIRKKLSPVRASAWDGEDEAHDDDASVAAHAATEGDTVEEVAHEDPSPPRSRASLVVLVGAIAVALVIGIYASSRSTTAQDLGGEITRTYGTSDACVTASLALKPADGVDLAKQGNAVLAGLEQIPGLGTATLFPGEGRIEIGYCGSSADEAMLVNALQATGLVQVTRTSPPPTDEAVETTTQP